MRITLGLEARTRGGLHAKDYFRRQCHRFFMVHDGPDNWIVEGAAMFQDKVEI